MLKRIREKLTGRSGRKGYTMTELLTVVAIIAVVCAIAIPSIFAIRRSLLYKENNEYAKTVFMAAQANLTNMRSDGQLAELASAEGADKVPEGTLTTLSDKDRDMYEQEYCYTTSFDASGEHPAAFVQLLPDTTIDTKVRNGNIFIGIIYFSELCRPFCELSSTLVRCIFAV